MIEPKQERYNWDFDDTINYSKDSAKLTGIAFDVCPKGDTRLTGTKKPCIILMSNERVEKDKNGKPYKDKHGEIVCHEPFGYFEFTDPSNLALAQTGLELIQKAIEDDLEF